MNSIEIFDAIEAIAAVSGKKDKEALIAKYGQDHEFMWVVRAALDPFVTYGMQKVPVRTLFDSENDAAWPRAKVLLGALASRQLTGNGAQEQTRQTLDALDAKSAELLTRIIKKDLRAGFGASTVNKCFKGAIATFPYMRCSLPKDTDFSKWDWERGVISQEKADGMFVNINVESTGVTLTSRQGTPIPQDCIQELAKEMFDLLPMNWQAHGELLVLDPGGKVCPREIGNGILNSVAQGGAVPEGHTVICHVWDGIPLSEVKSKNKFKTPYIKRFMGLAKSADHWRGTLVSPIETRVVNSLEEGLAHYRELLAKGKEGTILKKKDAIWKDGTSKEQIKLKLEVDVELKVVGFEDGKGKNEATFGSIICQSSDDALVVSVSGFTDAERQRIHDNRESTLGNIMTVRANSIMFSSTEGKPHSLFLPRFVEWRGDKTEADSLQRIKDQFESAIAA
ncbi:hypothetical protein [Castellaniella sp.]|uniref:ATP-dependent DNA ligase n=1 Tax=Castellaniella sp. TaxID=1955812 RepID=UPI002AFF6311|nr:hypothetical protein [Castellaniella sp.]